MGVMHPPDGKPKPDNGEEEHSGKSSISNFNCENKFINTTRVTDTHTPLCLRHELVPEAYHRNGIVKRSD